MSDYKSRFIYADLTILIDELFCNFPAEINIDLMLGTLQ